VYSQVALVAQKTEYGIGDSPDTQLERIAVCDEVRYMAPYLLL